MKRIVCSFSSCGRTFTKKAFMNRDGSLSRRKGNDAFDILLFNLDSEWALLFQLSDDEYVECVFPYDNWIHEYELEPIRAVTWRKIHEVDIVVDAQLFTVKIN